MYITLPERIPMSYAATAVAVLSGVLLLEGTSPLMMAEAAAFVLVGIHATNRAGGLLYPSGAYILFTMLLTCGVGMVAKAILGEPLNSHLVNGEYSMLVYLVGMVTLYAVCEINVRLRKKRGILEGSMARVDPTQAGVGCFLMAAFIPLILPPEFQGTFSLFNSAFIFLSIMIPVYFTTRRTGGRRTFHLVALLGWIYLTVFYGLLTFSKQGLLQPSAAWGVAAVAAGVRVSVRKAVVLTVAGLALAYYSGPYSQVGRNYRGDPELYSRVGYMLTHLEETRAEYEKMAKFGSTHNFHWYDQPTGLVDRLTLIPIDDALIYSKDHGGPQDGLTPVYSYLTNMLPRYIWPDKPVLRWGNHYAHEIGLLAPHDMITGVSFGASAEAYHSAGWWGVTFVVGLFYLGMFLVADSVSGDVRRSFWGLLYTLYFMHFAAEGSMAALSYTVGVFTPAVFGAMFISTRIAPMVGAAFALSREQTPEPARKPALT